MKITIVAVGLRQPDWAETAVTDYLARFPSDFRVELKTVKAETRSGQPAAKLMAAEAERIRAVIPSGSLIVAMDERGRDLT
ncbi:MAG: 23S rRNA (pseudouridine(1915)-N(3))-methyltransferase RlmH, partial [Burkholderiaceae bacterium]